MKFEPRRLILLLTNALLPGVGPLFYGISNLSVLGIVSGLSLILGFCFVLLIAINGEFHNFETYHNIFLAAFHKSNGHKLERSVWVIVMVILISTLILYCYLAHLSYKICLSLTKSQTDGERQKTAVPGRS